MTCVYHYHTPREREREKIAEYCSTDPKQINEKSSEYGSREREREQKN